MFGRAKEFLGMVMKNWGDRDRETARASAMSSTYAGRGTTDPRTPAQVRTSPHPGPWLKNAPYLGRVYTGKRKNGVVELPSGSCYDVWGDGSWRRASIA
mgnify:CR=1 FL=1